MNNLRSGSFIPLKKIDTNELAKPLMNTYKRNKNQ